MSAQRFRRIRFLWRRLPPLDRVLVVTGLVSVVFLLGVLLDLGVGNSTFVTFVLVVSLSLLLIRWIGRNRGRLLWSLRNRLVVAYLLIAVVPVLLLLLMAGLSAYLVYSQYGAYLFEVELKKRLEKASAVAETLAAVVSPSAPDSLKEPIENLPTAHSMLDAARGGLPGLQAEAIHGREALRKRLWPTAESGFSGIVQTVEGLRLQVVVVRPYRGDTLAISAFVPINSALLDQLVPELGPIQLILTRSARADDPPTSVLEFSSRPFMSIGQVSSRNRTLAEPAHWLDWEIKGLTNMEAVSVQPGGTEAATNPVFVTFMARPSQLNRRLFASLGGFGDFAYKFLLLLGLVFMMIEAVALVTGIRLTRTITRAVEELYQATRHVRTGDFTHRVQIQARDQLGVLGESFNEMTSSIHGLIEEQKQRQRLENEITIAREVQAELFPRSLPSLPGLRVAAVCRAARMVSGDYYDFVRIGPSHLAIVIADISGKGISAALLMASLQAALRSQLLMEGAHRLSTAELVARLNQHLYLNTSDDRYATLFFAVYDAETKTLRYTNAGHLPPVCVRRNQTELLETGGMVVGLFDQCSYEQGTVQMESGGCLVAYSDGLVEPENVFGEEFGRARVQAEILRNRDLPCHRLAEALMRSVEEWAGSPEQSDDMTVLVAQIE